MRVYASSRGTTGVSLGPVGFLIVAPLIVAAYMVWFLVWLLVLLVRCIVVLCRRA